MSFNLQFLRGYVEKLLDNQLTNEELGTSHNFFEVLKPAVKNREDAIFGYVIGFVFGQVNNLFLLVGRKPTQEEIEEISKAFTKRFLEIRSRINETFT